MSSGRVVRPGPMAEGRAQLKQKSNNRSQRLRDTPAFPIFHDDITSFGVTFPRLQDAGECLRIGAFMWKGDISDMYLNFPLRPDMYPHTVVELDGQRIVYLFMCFGIRSAVRLAQGVSVLITEILRRRMRAAGVQDDTVLGVFEYLDD